MSRLLGVAFLAFSSVATADPLPVHQFDLRMGIFAEPGRLRPGFQLPHIDYVSPGRALETTQGLIAGVEVSPKTVLGIGFFDHQRRMSALPPNPQLDRGRHRKNVAVGLSLRF
jgi:hypothetical protein